MEVAGNPLPHAYRVREVVAYSPGFAFGSRAERYASPTYSGFINNFGELTGYKFASREGWREPGTNYSAFERAFKNTYDAIDPQTADRWSPADESQLAAFKASGARLTISADTQDQFQPFEYVTEYCDKAMARNIPLKLRINYRGLTLRQHDMVSDANAAYRRLNGEFASGIEYYKIQDPSIPHEKPRYVQFTPTEVPVTVDLPKYAVRGGRFLFAVSGGPGTHFDLYVKSAETNQRVSSYSGELPALSAGAIAPISTFRYSTMWPTQLPAGEYELELRFQRPGDRDSQWARYVPVSSGENPLRLATLHTFNAEPMESGIDFCARIGCRKTGWGLSSE